MNSPYIGIALIIAISDYSNLEKLKNTLNDAREMRRELEQCNYDVISVINPYISDISTALYDVRIRLSRNSYDKVIVYYAGHGYVNETAHYILGREYDHRLSRGNQLILYAFSIEKLMSDICEISVAVNTKRTLVVILDTCRTIDEPIERNRRPDFTHSVESDMKFNLTHETRIGILVCYACARGRGARDSDDHGLYTKCVLEACFRTDTLILDAMGHANEQVVLITNNIQKPQLDVNFPHYFRFSLRQQSLEASASHNSAIQTVPSAGPVAYMPTPQNLIQPILHVAGFICIPTELDIRSIQFIELHFRLASKQEVLQYLHFLVHDDENCVPLRLDFHFIAKLTDGQSVFGRRENKFPIQMRSPDGSRLGHQLLATSNTSALSQVRLAAERLGDNGHLLRNSRKIAQFCSFFW